MNFAYPWSFILIFILIVLVGVLIILTKKNRRDMQSFAASDVLPEIIDLTGMRRRAIQLGLRIGCLFMLILALLGPQWGFRWRENRKQGPDLIFAVDTSKSMLAADVLPNRLERCKLAIQALLPETEGSKAGLIAFAGSAFLQCPPVEDFAVFQRVLSSINIQSIPRGGTAIGSAIRIARRSFSTERTGRKVLIIMTDGENHEGNPAREAALAAREGIRIYTIGIGSPDGTTIPVNGTGGEITYLKDKEGKIVKTKLNEDILKTVAATGGGTYLHSSEIDLGLKKLYHTRLIANASKTNAKWRKEPVNHFQLPLTLAILLFLLELGWGSFRKSKIVVPKNRAGE